MIKHAQKVSEKSIKIAEIFTNVMIEKEIDQKIDTYKKQLISKYMTFINKNFLRMKLYFNPNLIVYAICIFRLFFLLPLLKHLCIYAFLNEFLFQSLNQFLCYYYSYAHVQISKITLNFNEDDISNQLF